MVAGAYRGFGNCGIKEESITIETNLTDEERQIIAKGEEEYKKGGYQSLSDIHWN